MSVTALALFSGGLDSILACRVVMAQGIRVVALRFITPFFEADVVEPARYTLNMREKYGIEVEVIDTGHDYISMLKAPRHGFGRHFNPCIDCKIFMLRQARALMPKYGASFLITGEVIGQRPMSQRRDTLRIIERESGCEGILLRPLCAQLMPPTEPELQGLLNRDQLCRICGRGRSEQQALAAHFSIFDYPAPVGGCVLADVNVPLTPAATDMEAGHSMSALSFARQKSLNIPNWHRNWLTVTRLSWAAAQTTNSASWHGAAITKIWPNSTSGYRSDN